MRIFSVGGSVRDKLLGRPVHDRDFVVVGATVAEMLALGFTPVGKDFPVFHHPDTHEEYALARTERKTAPGYQGFAMHAAPDVTLEDDLARRDLTINAMATDEHGVLVDPYGGQRDLAARVLRHVGPAFAEDPVRILRLARFAARYTDFTVAPETMELMRQMVHAGEVDALVPERVWQEISRGLLEAKPSRMIEVLRESGALARLLPEIDGLVNAPQPAGHHPEGTAYNHTLLVIDYAAAHGFSLPVRVAALLHDLGKGITPAETLPSHHGHEEAGVPLVTAVCARLKVPAACRELAVLMTRYHTTIHQAAKLKASTMVSVMLQVDAFRRPARFQELLEACVCDSRGRLGFADRPYPQMTLFATALAAAAAVDAGAIARTVGVSSKLPVRIHEARVCAVKLALD